MSRKFGDEELFDSVTLAGMHEVRSACYPRGDNGRFIELMKNVVDDDEPAESDVPDGFFLLTGREAFAVGCFLTDVEVDVYEPDLQDMIEEHEAREAEQLLAKLEAESAEIDRQLFGLRAELDALNAKLVAAAKAAEMDVEKSPPKFVAFRVSKEESPKHNRKGWRGSDESHHNKPLSPKGAATIRRMEMAM